MKYVFESYGGYIGGLVLKKFLNIEYLVDILDHGNEILDQREMDLEGVGFNG